MEGLDRLVWADGISFESFGLRVGVRASSTDTFRRLREHFPPGWKASRWQRVQCLYSVIAAEPEKRGGRRGTLLFRELELIARSRNLNAVLEAFQADLHRFVAEWAPRRYFVHAGVVGWKGRAILVPGRSSSGKSTLVAELVRAGADYYSDEYAVFDGRGRVHAFPRPLVLRPEGNENQERLTAESLGGAVGSKPLRPGLVLVSRYRAGARWRPRPLTPGQGLLALLANSVSARRNPDAVLEGLRLGVAQAISVRGIRGEARDLAPAILDYAGELGAARGRPLRKRRSTVAC